MTGPARLLVLAGLLAVVALAASAAGQSGTRPISDDRWELAGLDDGSGEDRRDIHHAPRNATFDARVRFLAHEDIDDTMEVRVDRGRVNRSSLPVDVDAGQVFSAVVEVSRIREAGDETAELVATLRNTTWRDGAIRVTDRIQIIPQPRAELVQPPNIARERIPVDSPSRDRAVALGHREFEADWDEEVEVRARLENPWDVPTRPLPLRVLGEGQVVEGRTVAPLAPGETRTVSVANVTREEVTRSLSHGRDPVRRSPEQVQLRLVAAEAEEDERESLWNYTFPAADLRADQQVRGVVAFHAGLDVSVPDPDLELGRETTLEVEVRNRGGVPARPAPVDLRVGPVPDLAYGVESGTSRSLTVDLAPGESRSVDLSLTPRVGAKHEVEATVEGADRSRSTGHVTEVESPVDLRVTEGRRGFLELGETVEATLVVRGPADLEGDLGVVASVRDAVHGFDGDPDGTPFSTLLTTSTLVDASFEPAALEAGSGDATNRTVALELTPKAAGQVAVVPVLRVDGLVHTGLEDENAVRDGFPRGGIDDRPSPDRRDRVVQGIVALDVHPSGTPGPAVVAPPALVLLGLAGVEVHRRWFVR